MKQDISCVFCGKIQEHEINMKGFKRNKILTCEKCNKKFRIKVDLLINKYMVDESGKDLNKNSN